MSDSVFYDKSVDRFFSNRSTTTIMPITLCYHIGYNCNLDCDYCLSKNNDVRHSAINLVKHIQYMSAWRPLRVVISGGEPLMYVDELSKILQCLREKGINSFISTNGTLIEKEYFKLQGLPDWYDISLPAITKETYFKVRGQDGFSKVLKGINLLVSKGERVRLTFTINEHNIGELLNFPEFAISCGVDNVRIGHTYSYEDGMIKQKLWTDKYHREISKYEDKLKIYYPLSDEQMELYNLGYIVLENDGSIYRSMVHEDKYICNVAEIEKYEDEFYQIGNIQAKLFIQE